MSSALNRDRKLEINGLNQVPDSRTDVDERFAFHLFTSSAIPVRPNLIQARYKSETNPQNHKLQALKRKEPVEENPKEESEATFLVDLQTLAERWAAVGVVSEAGLKLRASSKGFRVLRIGV